jgi:hypothetical protein
MSSLTILLIMVALLTLVLGFLTFRLTSSRSMILNTFLGTAGLVFAAYAAVPEKHPIAYVLPFFVSMIFAGRGIGTLWRSRKDTALLLPSTFMLTVAAASLYATLAAYFAH